MEIKKQRAQFVKNKQALKEHLVSILKEIKNGSKTDLNEFIDFSLTNGRINESYGKWKSSSVEEELIFDLLINDIGILNEFDNYTEAFAHLLIKDGLIDSLDAQEPNYELPGYELLDDHGFECLGYTSGGDVIAINMYNKKIVFFNHEATYTSSEHLEEMYSEFYEFYFDDEENSFDNENNLLIDKVYNSEGNFDTSSPYIKKMLNEDDEIGELDFSYLTIVAYAIHKSHDLYRELFEKS